MPYVEIESKNSLIQYLEACEYSAGQELNFQPAPQRQQDPVVINFGYGLRPFWVWNPAPLFDFSTHTTIINAPAQPQTQKEKDQENADFWKVVGSVIAVFFTFIAVYTWGIWSRCSETCNITEKLRDDLVRCDANRPEHLRGDVYIEVLDFASNQLIVDELNVQRISWYALAALGALGAGVLMAAGGFAVVPWMITAGQVLIVASAMFAAANLAIHWNDDQEKTRCYRRMFGSTPGQESACQQILQALRNTPPDYQAHQPMYAEFVAQEVAMEPVPAQRPPAYNPDA